MSASILLRYTVAIAAAAPLCVQADSFNAKPGTWETTTVSTTTGVPADEAMLAKMSAGMRAKYEQSMLARSGKPMISVSRECIAQQDFDQNNWLNKDGDDDCTKRTDKVIFKSAGKLTVERICSAPHARTMKITVESPNPQRIISSADIVSQGSGGKIHVDTTSRWLGAACSGNR
ncbi:DUF3617 domain-containing protein [Undibacterium sp.]|uniref:DUF3617 domain-containing protein n=1 Tax=Undibacterium sp. TaxID=1914977 RepID=UPI002C565339|nr:DUF3617 family protein [Undibacterium sp.]HTD02771.1 DUF3617 family protein [Undibacterium sp.]